MPNYESDKLSRIAKELQKSYSSDVFRDLYDILSPKLYFVCLRYLKVKDDAQDALQESLIIIYEKIKTYKGIGSFEGWARKIAVNHCILLLKKRKIEFDHTDFEMSYVEKLPLEKDEDNIYGKKKLKEALMELPDGFRTVFNLYILEEYSHKEIAEMLNINEGTSRSQLNRAKVALRKLMLVAI